MSLNRDARHVLTRRQFVVRGLATLASAPLVVAACGEVGSGGGETNAAQSEGGPWKFTDDRGVEVSLDGPPRRIVAHEYALAAMWDYGIRPIGVYGSVSISDQPIFAGLDLDGVESVGEVWGEVNLEALAALQPDLIVSTYWPSQKLLGGVKDQKVEAKMEALAPFVGINAQVPATTTIERFEDLAGALGGDVQSAEIKSTRASFENAVGSFRRAVEAKPGLRAMAVYADPEALYVGKTVDYSELREFEGWGLEFLSGEGSDPYWEIVSWENADRYPADLILHDSRAHAPSLDELTDIPLWNELPAVGANQLAPWHMEEAVSYRLFTEHIEELTAVIERSQVVAS
jgi:iron complex transport system substrate-binding protein